MASQRLEIVVLEILGTEWIREVVDEWKKKERGAFFGVAECVVILYVISLVWAEIRALWTDGLCDYLSDLWNIVDFITNTFYVMWITLRMCAWYVVRRESSQGRDPWYPREEWQPFDPMLLSEGAFAAGMIFSFLKLVHIFSVSPHLGPLQISLGRMIIDIVKFFFIYTLVLFAFGCGLNQLLWYYAELEKNKCYLPNGLPDFENNERACTIWRRYANLFETSQSLFWASFGLVDLVSFDLKGIKGFTRFWALLMFGSYSVINVIVLLNMLIAMMSNSYQIISERADIEWKFARSCLWLNYFDEGDTLPPPFNIFPTPKSLFKNCQKNPRDNLSFKKKSRNNAQLRHETTMRLLVRRYITAEQQKGNDYDVSEDDIREIRQDISTLRYELINILRKNGMQTPQVSEEETQVAGKKDKVMERRILGDFYIGAVEGVLANVANSKSSKNLFTQIAKAIKKRSRKSKREDWNTLVRKDTINRDPIGTTEEAESSKQRRQSLRQLSNVEHDKLIEYNANLSDVSKATRVAYAKFMTKKIEKRNIQKGDEKLLEEDAKGFATDDSLKDSLTAAATVENESENSEINAAKKKSADAESIASSNNSENGGYEEPTQPDRKLTFRNDKKGWL